MRKKSFLLLLAAGLFVLSACSDQSMESERTDNSARKWNDIQKAGEIVVGTSGTLIAGSYYEDNDESKDALTGYEVEVAREVAKRLDLDIKFEIIGFDSVLAAVDSGRIDVAGMGITDKRKEKFNFSEPFKYSYTTMVVREDTHSGIEKLEDLEGKEAGGASSTIYSEIARKFGAEVVTYGNAPNEAYLRDVNNGRTDVVINDYYLSKFGVAAFPDFDITLHPDLKFHTTRKGLIMADDADRLQEKINQTLQSMREDGTLTQLAKKFYKEDASKKPEGDIRDIKGLDF
ncbi:putative ABC transporter extracellular-binding protein YckB [Lentibacillus kapialis]|uniref:ABC transporter extracellular-binding protein YckB n=1 Tax=Lentibacillus kapialis TaxID=340214 RepID=A0A917UZP0_9BACI|nr:transporter substrate-binding domain-containing protein [Lentibacillus kapialis]GGK03944.1 putative ABC transporter extracellular-binding protein YckB [Lentibacillus kapialis]